jgi:hypothetical protein
MKPLKPIVFLALAAAIAFAIYSLFFPPAEKVITKNLKSLASAISSNPGGNIARVANVSKIGSFFHPNVQISLQGFGREVASVSGRGELEQMALAARQNLGSIKVQFFNIAVHLAESGTEARVNLTALVNINNQTDPAVQPVQIQMERVERKWLIRSASPGGEAP